MENHGFSAYFAAALMAHPLVLAWPADIAHADDTRGAWSEVFDWPIIAVHTVLTPDGRVLSYGSSTTGQQGARSVYDVWNPANGTGFDSHLTLPNGSGVDSFCSGQLLLPQSGEVIAIGGNTVDGVNRFDYRDNSLRRGGRLAGNRWYGTLTILPNGQLLSQGGRDQGAPDKPPITTPGLSDDGVSWRLLDGAGKYPPAEPGALLMSRSKRRPGRFRGPGRCAT